MRPSRWRRLGGPRSRSLLAAFCIGAVVGLVAMVPLSARQVEQLRDHISRAEDQIKHNQTQVERLDEELKKRRWALLVQDTRAVVDHEDARVEVAVSRTVQDLLHPLIGRPVADLDPHFVLRRLQGKRITVEGRTYAIHVTLILMGSQVTVYVEPETIRPDP